jgi:hypothetical protein
MHEKPIRIINRLSVYENGDILCVNSSGGTETCTHLVIETCDLIPSKDEIFFCLIHIVQRSSGAHPAFSTVGARGFFAGEWS